jgi:1,4-dihydroxy-2-naphthoate octaprenyltransferase
VVIFGGVTDPARRTIMNWILASRPKTLVATIVPVIIGAAYASRSVAMDWPILLCALASALCIQIGTNLANDYSDFKKGADTAERLGPVRVTQAGLIKPSRVKAGAMMAFGLAVVFGIPLILRGGWPLLLIGVLSILSGWAYTGGPYPLGYNGLGELFVFLFFGLAAVVGTDYVLTLRWDPLAFVIACIPGLHASALLAINNLRDVDTDRAVGKRTLAARFGRSFGRWEFMLFLLVPFAIPPLLFGFKKIPGVAMILPMASLLLATEALRLAFTRTDGPSLIKALGRTALVQLFFGIMFTIGLLL